MLLLRPSLILALAACGWSSISVVARQAKENKRDFQKLNDEDLEKIVNLPPAQWESVNEGHLQRMLIPRAGELLPTKSVIER